MPKHTESHAEEGSIETALGALVALPVLEDQTDSFECAFIEFRFKDARDLHWKQPTVMRGVFLPEPGGNKIGFDDPVALVEYIGLFERLRHYSLYRSPERLYAIGKKQKALALRYGLYQTQRQQ